MRQNKMATTDQLDERPETIIIPGTPLYADMKDILERAAKGELKFYTYEQVFGTDKVDEDG